MPFTFGLRTKSGELFPEGCPILVQPPCCRILDDMNMKNTEMGAADVSPLVATDRKTEGPKSRLDEPWVTMADVCRHFRMSRTTVWRNVRAGMPVHRLGHRLRFLLSEVHAWLEKS